MCRLRCEANATPAELHDNHVLHFITVGYQLGPPLRLTALQALRSGAVTTHLGCPLLHQGNPSAVVCILSSHRWPRGWLLAEAAILQLHYLGELHCSWLTFPCEKHLANKQPWANNLVNGHKLWLEILSTTFKWKPTLIDSYYIAQETKILWTTKVHCIVHHHVFPSLNVLYNYWCFLSFVLDWVPIDILPHIM